MECGVGEVSNFKICTASGESLGVKLGIFVFSGEWEVRLPQALVRIISKMIRWILNPEFLLIIIASEVIFLFLAARSWHRTIIS